MSAYLWGQNIVEVSPEPTEPTDYMYITRNDSTEIIRYIGDIINPELPSEIDGKPITIIAATAFGASEVRSVYIPDGVIEIE